MHHSDESDSEFLQKEPCPACGSKDNLARYTDGHAWCFGCHHHEPADDGEGSTRSPGRKPMTSNPDLIDNGSFKAIPKRGLSEDTCRRYGYQIGRNKGAVVHLANYRNETGEIVAQKMRFADKDEGMPWVGNPKQALMFGQWVPTKSFKKLVVTEGEIDAMSMSQVQGNKWPVWSLTRGADGAVKDFKAHLEALCKFEKVVLMFDMDEPGQRAAENCARLLPPGKAMIAKLPLKDANEMLVAGRNSELLDAMWTAQPYRPDGIRPIEEFFEAASKPVVVGIPWFLPKLTDATYGRRPGEVYGFGAPTGGGKTSIFTQQMAFDVKVLGMKVGAFYLETPPVELTRRAAGKMVGTTFHIPGEGGTLEQFWEAAEQMRGKVEIYDHFGETDWEIVKSAMRHMIVAEDVKLIYLDHLTAMADPRDERASLEVIMEEMATLAQETGAIIHYISHLTTPEGKPHEEGGRVTVRHFKGSRAIGFWSHFMFGIERDQQDVGALTTFRVLKDRYTGRSNGLLVPLAYDRDTDCYREATAEDIQAANGEDVGGGFRDETGGDGDIPF